MEICPYIATAKLRVVYFWELFIGYLLADYKTKLFKGVSEQDWFCKYNIVIAVRRINAWNSEFYKW